MEMHDIVSALYSGPQSAVLATIIDVEGHAYRKRGAVMALWADGSVLGHLSPGCLETDLMEHAQALLEDGTGPRIMDYDMRSAEDLAWGEAAGCGGTLRILAEPVAGELKRCLAELKRRLDGGEDVRFERLLRGEGSGLEAAYRLLPADAAGTGSAYLSASWPREEEQNAGRLSRVLSYVYKAKRRVVIFGAGPDAVPVANGALKAGFRVTAADWRQAICASGAFDPAVERMVGFPAELVPKLQLNKQDYVIIMSHQLQRDQQFLDLIWPQPLAYLGILGSRFRTRQLLDGRRPLEWLHAPIGLDIGAEGAEEIAVSIVAELIYTRRRAEAGWRKGADATGDSSDLFGRREELPHGGV